MGVIVLILIIVGAIAIFMRNSQKSSLTQQVPQNDTNKADYKKQPPLNDYLLQNIQGIGLQSMETVHLIGTSNAIDTIKGRYNFLLKLIPVLQKNQNHPRYLSDIQRSIDNYKSLYYNTIPQDYELEFLLKPGEFDLSDFYCNSLFEALKRNVENHTEEIKMLKREDAKIRRKEKIKNLIQLTKEEIKKECSAAKSFATVMQALETMETIHPAETENKTSPTSLINKSVQLSVSHKIPQPVNEKLEFIINPGSTFELTLIGADNVLGKKIKNILSDDKIWDSKKKQFILALFSEFNLKVKEVEIYKQKYQKVYFDKLEELKASSTEWSTSGELDRADLLEDYRETALQGIFERANCDLITLFENEPSDITIDDTLIKEYGFENIQTYMRFADNLNKVRVIPNSSYNRLQFEKLVELGLAIRGSSIALPEILSILTLKDLNEIANNSDKEFKRKNQAIEYILTASNIEEKIGSKISLRELFKLKPLPEKYSSVDLQEISNAWSYTNEVVELLVNTYRHANFSSQRLQEKEFVKHYKVECWNNENIVCPCAKELISKTYLKSKPPKIPYHIGCNCSIEPEYNFSS